VPREQPHVPRQRQPRLGTRLVQWLQRGMRRARLRTGYLRLGEPGQGVECRVQGSGFRAHGSGCMLCGSGLWVEGLGFRVWGLGFRVYGVGCRVETDSSSGSDDGPASAKANGPASGGGEPVSAPVEEWVAPKAWNSPSRSASACHPGIPSGCELAISLRL